MKYHPLREAAKFLAGVAAADLVLPGVVIVAYLAYASFYFASKV